MISVVLSHIVVNYLRRNDESFFTYVLRDAMAKISYLSNGALGMDSFFCFFLSFSTEALRVITQVRAV